MLDLDAAASLLSCDHSEDQVLEVVDNSVEVVDSRNSLGFTEVKVCGNTSHFTDFGVFLGEGGNGAASCSSNAQLPFVLWILHVVSVSALFLCVVAAVVLMLYSQKVQRITWEVCAPPSQQPLSPQNAKLKMNLDR